MAAAATSVPVKLLHEAEGHDVTIELKSGELYRGRLLASEETMNVQLSKVVHQARDGRVTRCGPWEGAATRALVEPPFVCCEPGVTF